MAFLLRPSSPLGAGSSSTIGLGQGIPKAGRQDLERLWLLCEVVLVGGCFEGFFFVVLGL